MKVKRSGFSASRLVPVALVTACSMLSHSSSWNVLTPFVPAASAQSVVKPATSGEREVSREASTLARRILERKHDELILDERHIDQLGREIALVLRLIRHRYPAMAEITVREPPQGLIVAIEGELFDDISERWTELDAGIAPPTGNAAFDDLNATLDARMVDVWPYSKAVLLEFPERTNLTTVRQAYAAIPGVAGAEFDERLIDGPDIAAFEKDETWFVAMRNAWGDCPSGCIHVEMDFFTVKDGHVERLDKTLAERSPAFRMLEVMTMIGGWWR
ncbi:MAG: hypothetical protein OXL68_07370 [Paracoccaceae bacterium]|nr:hypothetical protein [Paracoccaceae bacterium]